MLSLVRALALSAILLSAAFAADWETLENCRLVSSSKNDGDSFVVEHEGTEYHFRLYFVDTPETGLFYPERVEEQADYFDAEIEDMLRIGERSEDFARRFLSGRFAVYTRWADAMGSNRRYAALIYNRRGESLIEALVENGYARLKGFRPPDAWPGGESSSDYDRKLAKLERTAKRDRQGAWRKSDSASTRSPSRFDEEPQADPNEATAPSKLDLNQASAEELTSLPGIGPVYAERIVSLRPFTRIDDLLTIRGIGPKTLERFRSRVTLSLPESFAGTARYYLLEPETWANQEVPLKVSGLRPLELESPDQFQAFLAETGDPTVEGGTLRLYLHEKRVANALAYFAQNEDPVQLDVYFFRYREEWVTVLREN